MTRTGYYLAWGALIFASGCGDSSTSATAQVQGQVTIDGQLASRGTVSFYPEKEGPVATGRIHADGSYALRVGQGNTSNPDASKIVPGKYTATVVVRSPPDPATADDSGGPPDAGQRLSAAGFASAETSGLVFDVKKGMNLFPLNIEGASADDQVQAGEADEDGVETIEETAGSDAGVSDSLSEGNADEDSTDEDNADDGGANNDESVESVPTEQEPSA